MTRRPDNDLDRLARALHDGAPAPDPTTRKRAMAHAMENFDALAQGKKDALRPNQDRPEKRAGFLTGVRTMFVNITSRPILAATTSAAALCLGFIAVLPLDRDATPDIPATITPTAIEPAPAPQPEESILQEAPLAEISPKVADSKTASTELAQTAPAPAQEPLLRERGTSRFQATAPEPAQLDTFLPPRVDSETFASAETNPVKVTTEEPVSTFSIDVDTAAYSVIRNSLMSGFLPPVDAVRIEEMVNYFPYDYPAPEANGAPFQTSVTVMPTPWNEDTQLVRIGLQGRLPALKDRPPLNLVFLVDTSGSMRDTNKLPLLKQSLRLMLDKLRPDDEVAIVAYAGSAGTVLEPVRAADRSKILAALDTLEAGGSTAGAEGLELAYQTAQGMAEEGEVSRILLATDGDFNVGISDPEELETYIARKRDEGSYLSVLGFGRGNLDDTTMQALAQNGNGQAAYIDTLQEAQKVLVDQLSGALFPIADDVKIQVEWNPAEVAEYRLIGYETRALKREDFNNDRIDAGEIGAGHAVTALYEVTPPDSPALLNNQLRYQEPEPAAVTNGELGFLRLRYKEPGESRSNLIESPVQPGLTADGEARFAAAIAGFGQLLTGATYLGDWGWDDAIALAQENRGEDAYGYRNEAVKLMRLAQSLSAK
ncbi:MAG: vWA domain-containing protein [Pseudorhodobacter sp.]